MEYNNLAEYNLSKISDIDKRLMENNKQKNKFMKYHSKRYKIYKFLTKLTGRLFQTILILASTIIVYLLFNNPFYSVIISLNFISFVNLLINMFITIFETKDDFLLELCKYRKEYNELIDKRKCYINLYNYSLYGDVTILNNIKLRINNGSYCDYNNSLCLGFDSNSYEVNTLNIMKKKEDKLRNSIKNKVYWELNSPLKSENLSMEELRTISLAL